MLYARVTDGVVREIIDDLGNDINTMFHTVIIATLAPCDDTIRMKDTFDGSSFGPALPPPTLSWEDNRRATYATFGAQLDMQYWDGVNDTTVWADHIATVKATYPKPEG